MASSSYPWDTSYLNTTSGLLAVLDLNPKSNEDMEDMDIDQIIEVPDTPDQSVMRSVSRDCGKYGPRDDILSLDGDSESPEIFDEESFIRKMNVGKWVNGNGYSKRLDFSSQKNTGNSDISGRQKDSCFHPSGNSSTSMSSHLFRKIEEDKTFKHGTHARPHHRDKGKSLCTKLSSKSCSRGKDESVADLTDWSKVDQILNNEPHHRVANDIFHREVKGTPIEPGGCLSRSSKEVSKNMKETSICSLKGASPGVNGNMVNSKCKSQFDAGNDVPASSHGTSSHRVTRKKHLVKNGCISPHNIAKANESAEQLALCSKGLEGNCARSVVCDPASESHKVKDKGKGVITHPFATSNDVRFINVSSRTQATQKEHSNSIRGRSTDASADSDVLSGWRTTRNRSNTSKVPSDCTEENLRSNISSLVNQNGNRVEKRDKGLSCSTVELGKSKDASIQHGATRPLAPEASNLASESGQGNAQNRQVNLHIKRQRKQASVPSHAGECSRPVLCDSEVECLGSSGKTSSVRLRRDRSRPCQSVPDVVEIDYSGSERRQNASNVASRIDDDSDARARQVEADEMLARELQEQLYHESPVFGGDGINAIVARAMQQEEDNGLASLRNRGESLLRSTLTSRLQFRSNMNNQVRRGSQGQVLGSNRTSQTRQRSRGQSAASMLTESIFPFPVEMDLDRRMDILETLERVATDTVRASNIMGIQRDFNENDYEMLLALDENNDQHNGASISRINSLPQSTVQTNNFEEACVICLETPTTGDTIRHLPCLHKFHKDCIDPWLSRRTSCPVCKSSIC